MCNISARAKNTPPSPIRSLAALAAEAQRRGIHVHKLNIGQPDVHSPVEFLDGVRKFDEKIVAYDSSPGNAQLLKRWCDLLNRQYAIDVSPSEMVITSGSSEALTFAFSICCDVNDDILVFEPTYANYTGFASLAGINLIPVQCSIDDGFHLPTKDAIVSKLTDNTKAILVCNPNNPTGTTLTEIELEILVELCEERDLFLIVDEVYREFVYDGREAASVFQTAPKNPRVVVIDSVSKRYSLCGARVGCLISWNKKVMAAANNLASTRVSSATIEQVATAHMLATIDDSYLADSIEVYRSRNSALSKGLSSIPGVELNEAEGGFYVLAKLPVTDAEDFAKFMLSDFSLNGETVFLAPATGFYITPGAGKSAVRVAFVLEERELLRAVEIIRKALETYNGQSDESI